MKFCPYCGASLLGGAVSFCAECGKPIPASSNTEKAEDPILQRGPGLPRLDEQWEETIADERQPKASKNQLAAKKKKRPHPKRAPKKKSSTPPVSPDEEEGPREDGYDGYYDDVRPIDNGHEKESMDPELIKKIIWVAAGAAAVITLAVTMMLLL